MTRVLTIGTPDAPAAPDWVTQRFLSPGVQHLPLPPAPPALANCNQKIGLGSPEEPPEYCSEEALPGLELCQEHSDRHDDADWDLYREQRFV